MSDGRKRKLTSSIFVGNLVMIILPVVIVALVINYVLHQYLVNDITQKDKMMLYNVKQNVEAFLNDAADTLEYVSLTTRLVSGTDMNDQIDQINNIKRYYENIEILDQKGTVVNTLLANQNQIGHNRSGEDYYDFVQKENVYWSAPFISSVSGEPTVTIALKNEEEIIVGYLSLNRLIQLTNKFTEADPGLKASILDSHGIFISSNDIDQVHQRLIEPNFNLIKENATLNWPNEFRTTSEQIGFSIKTSKPEWYLIIYDDYKNSIKKIDTLLYVLVFIFFASVLIFIALALIRSSKINKYIKQFISQTEEIAAGKFDIDFPEQKYEEFDKLEVNFSKMAENLKARDHKLEQMAYKDSLTGIYNRAYLYNPKWQDKFADAEVFGLIFLDIDNFKNINDNYGHTFGDLLLIEVSQRLQSCITEKSVFSRFGGDEFVIVVPDHKDETLINETVKSIMDAFKMPVKLENRSFFVTVSMGISVSARTNYDFDMTLKAADIAMYQTKENGKNNYRFYSPEMDNKVKKRLQIEQNLRSALEENELTLVYQPQVLTVDGKIRGFEALVRWESKELGSVSPVDFIPVAEETGMIINLGEWVFRTACETIGEINRRNGTDYVMSINVSPVEFNNPYFIRNLYEIIEETGIKNDWIEIEITENVFLLNIDEVTTILLHLKLNGISVSLDDFGTGYSSLSYLNKLPIQTLKIDRDFIKNLNHNQDDQKMVDSIIILAHKLGIFLVAEGVENQNQVEILNDFSCDCIQGYYFSKPLDKEDLMKYLYS